LFMIPEPEVELDDDLDEVDWNEED
jgi:hypothetical protein